jgi:hypothetical protein
VSRNGIAGNVTFEQTSPGQPVTVRVALDPVPKDGGPPSEPFRIAIYSNPVDYSAKEPCRGLGDDM